MRKCEIYNVFLSYLFDILVIYLSEFCRPLFIMSSCFFICILFPGMTKYITGLTGAIVDITGR